MRVPVPDMPETKRLPAHISSEEIAEAIRLVVQYSIGISPESLIIETAKIFGFNPKNEKNRIKILKVYNEMLFSGVIFCKKNVVTLP